MSTRTISIWLDNYDDIFSDFDPRPYPERTLSDDFLLEVRKVCSETNQSANEFILLMPVEKRNAETEIAITKRLHSQFKQSYQHFQNLNKGFRKKAATTLFIGSILMLVASYISSLHSKNFILNALLILLEPTGWFLVWYGLDEIFYRSRQNKNEFGFYNIIAKSKILFSSIK